MDQQSINHLIQHLQPPRLAFIFYLRFETEKTLETDLNDILSNINGFLLVLSNFLSNQTSTARIVHISFKKNILVLNIFQSKQY